MTLARPSLGAFERELPGDAAPFETAATQAPRRCRAQHALQLGSNMRTILAFSAWAHAQRHFPTVDQVRTRFSVSRATAYRWLAALADCYGIERPRAPRKPTAEPAP